MSPAHAGHLPHYTLTWGTCPRKGSKTSQQPLAARAPAAPQAAAPQHLWWPERRLILTPWSILLLYYLNTVIYIIIFPLYTAAHTAIFREKYFDIIFYSLSFFQSWTSVLKVPGPVSCSFSYSMCFGDTRHFKTLGNMVNFYGTIFLSASTQLLERKYIFQMGAVVIWHLYVKIN